MKKMILLLAVISCFSCTQSNNKTPHVLIKTEYGDIVLELYPEKAPKTVAAFLANIDAGIYKDASFYRVLKNEDLPEEYNQGVIQGGVFQAKPELVPPP